MEVNEGSQKQSDVVVTRALGSVWCELHIQNKHARASPPSAPPPLQRMRLSAFEP